MKAFPYENGHRHPYYQNELRFASLQHENVVKSLYFQDSRKTRSKGVVSKISYKVMEYAPYGDFHEFVTNCGSVINEKIARTYFKQLIEGLEYLHLHGVSHLDLKLENLLLGEDFGLKIADFDLSYIEGDPQIISRGTKNYRAPELIQGRCRNPNAADIYSAGILLFLFKSKGVLPHAENNLISGVNYSQLLHNNDPQFWIQHCRVQKKEWAYFEKDFRDLFLQMTQFDPEKRSTIEMIKKSRWYNGPCYTQDELRARMNKLFKSSPLIFSE